MKKNPCLWIIIPCYNESEVLPITAPMFSDKIEQLVQEEKIAPDSRILFVNDGSKDDTWEIICRLSAENPRFQGICQSRNRGHQNAVLAGLMEAKDRCDITISIDCDGQDDINAMDQMVEEYLNGCEIVYGVRSSRETDTWRCGGAAPTIRQSTTWAICWRDWDFASYLAARCGMPRGRGLWDW